MGSYNAAGVEAVGEREVGARFFIDVVLACLPPAVRFAFFSLLVMMQVSTLFGMNVDLIPVTFDNVPAIPRSPLRASFASLYSYVL